VIAVAGDLTKIDVLLLKAALLDGKLAHAAYEAWRPTFDIETADYGHQRLLPLLHRNLTRLGITDPLLARLRGIRHYHWARNQLRLQAALPVVKGLHAAAIPVMTLKGAALLASCLDDFSLRPMDDVDLMVPLEHVVSAVEILTSHGFHPIGVPPWAISNTLVRRVPGFEFVNRNSEQHIDLHWHMLHRDQRENADASFWRSARPGRLADVDILTPSYSSQLLHSIAHAAEWNPVTPLRWVADSLTILMAARGEFNWEELERETIVRHLTPPMRDALHLLKREFEIAVPVDILRALNQESRQLERIEFAGRRVPPHRRSRACRLFLALCDLRRRRNDLMQKPLARSLKPFLAEELKASGIKHQAAALLFRGLGRPQWLRRIFRIDRWARRISSDSLPPLGTPIDFEACPAGRAAFIDGWSFPELTGRWTEGDEARLAWTLPPGQLGEFECEIEAVLFAPPIRRTPKVEIWANDHLVQRWCHASVSSCKFMIPASVLLGQTTLVLTFAVRGAISPHRVGLSDDLRNLGLHLRCVCIRPITEGSEASNSSVSCSPAMPKS
jgi:hypothetical protein